MNGRLELIRRFAANLGRKWPISEFAVGQRFPRTSAMFCGRANRNLTTRWTCHYILSVMAFDVHLANVAKSGSL